MSSKIWKKSIYNFIIILAENVDKRQKQNNSACAQLSDFKLMHLICFKRI